MISIVYPYYNNIKAFDAISKKLEMTPCEIIIVDDGSSPRLETECAKVIRIEEDRPWNQANANNIGMSSVSLENVILRLDIDHFIEPEDFSKFEEISKNIPEKTIYRFKRFRLDINNFINTGCNIIMIKSKDFQDIGKYNEIFCGNYGYEDKEFLDRAIYKGYKIVLIESLIVYVDGKFKTPNVIRDTSINKKKYDAIINSKNY